MEILHLETRIAAPVERCFLLSLNMDLHQESTARTHEQAIAGVIHGLIGPGETVTFRARHFGLMLTHTSIISAYDKPNSFEDSMVEGAFTSFVHRHGFAAESGGTLMTDELRFTAPLGPLGRIAEKLVLRKYLRAFLVERNLLIQTVAQSADRWVRYLV
jgi:ligand-binding SRPBCC domain-containing protein